MQSGVVQFRLIGEWSAADRGGRPLSIAGKQREILSTLLLADRAVSDDELLIAGWGPDCPPSRKASLHTYISSLRAILGTDVLPTAKDGRYELSAGHSASDIRTFREELARARKAEHDHRPQDAIACYERAAEIWPQDRDLIVTENSVSGRDLSRLHQDRKLVSERLGDLLIQFRRAGEALPVLWGQLAEDSSDERAWTLLARAEWQAHGKQPALRIIQQAAQVLREEYGHEKPDSLIALERDILQLPADADGSGEDQRTFLSTLPITDPQTFGRAEVLSRIESAWHDRVVNLFTITAWAGVGKTAVVNRFLHAQAGKAFDMAPRVYAWSFSDQGGAGGTTSADLFIQHALRWFGDPDPLSGDAWARGVRLAHLIQRVRTLLVLDGVETLQFPPGASEGRLKDPGLAALVRELAVSNPGLLITTSRIEIGDLVGLGEPQVARVTLPHLPPAAGAQLLRSLGTVGGEPELRQAAADYNGHALALTLLASWLEDVHDGDIGFRSAIPALHEDLRRGGQARRVLASYEAWIGEGPELELLRMLGFFDRPATMSELRTFRSEPVIGGLNSALCGLSEAQWRQTLSKLSRAKLITVSEYAVDTHPLVRQYFGSAVRRDFPAAWRQGNQRLFRHFMGRAPERADTREEMEPMFRALRYGCEGGFSQQALHEVYLKRIMRGNQRFAVVELNMLSSLVSGIACFFEGDGWTSLRRDLPEEDRLLVVMEAALFLSAARGYSDPDAGQCYAKGAHLAEILGQRDRLYEARLGLIRYNRLRGEVRTAMATASELAGSGRVHDLPTHLRDAVRREHISTAFYLGRFAEVAAGAEQTPLDLADLPTRRRLAPLVANDPYISCKGYGALADWFLGRPDRALKSARATTLQARELGHPHTYVVALLIETMIRQFRGEINEVTACASQLTEVAASSGLFQWSLAGRVFGSWATALSEPEAADTHCARMQAYIESWERGGAQLFTPYWYWMLAAAASETGVKEMTGSALIAAWERCRASGESWWEAELARLDAITGRTGLTEGLQTAQRAAASQASPGLRLRAVVDGAAHTAALGRREEALRLVTGALRAVEGGAGTADVEYALALSSALAHPPGTPSSSAVPGQRRGNRGVPRLMATPPS